MSEGIKNDKDKVRWELLPSDSLECTARVLTHGAKKYEARNWEKGIAWSRVFGAAMRHLWSYWRGQNTDPESGLPHLAHAACCINFLLAYQLRNMKEFDDRERLTTRDARALQEVKHDKVC